MTMSVNSAFELECAQELLRRSRQGEGNSVPTASVEELLGRPMHPVLVKNTILLEYLDPVQDRVSRTFSDEKDLLSVFTGVKFQDAVFAGLDEAGYRYKEVYPKPYADPYFFVNHGAEEESFGLPVLLANSGWAWTGWHVDREPGADIVSQLQRGSKLWFFEMKQRESRLLTIANKGSLRSLPRSVPSTLLEDLRRNPSIQFCIQKAGDVVYFPARACHCVLSGPGLTSLLTLTFEDSLEELAATSKAVAERQGTGKRKLVDKPGSRKKGRGQGRRVFSKR